MNKYIPVIVISACIAFFCLLTRGKDTKSETNTSYFIKVFIISFVSIYFGNMYFSNTSLPEIEIGEPDF